MNQWIACRGCEINLSRKHSHSTSQFKSSLDTNLCMYGPSESSKQKMTAAGVYRKPGDLANISPKSWRIWRIHLAKAWKLANVLPKLGLANMANGEYLFTIACGGHGFGFCWFLLGLPGFSCNPLLCNPLWFSVIYVGSDSFYHRYPFFDAHERRKPGA